MGKTIKLDHEFDPERFAAVLKRAMRGEPQWSYAKSVGISRTYLNRRLNGKLADSPPTLAVIEKIARYSGGGGIYVELLDAAGYDCSKYKNMFTEPKDPEYDEWRERIFGIILANVFENYDEKMEITLENTEPANNLADLRMPFKSGPIECWDFAFINEEKYLKKDADSRLYAYWGFVLLNADKTNIKLSFVTDSQKVYDNFIHSNVSLISAYISIILVDMNEKTVLQETVLKSALKGKSNIPHMIY